MKKYLVAFVLLVIFSCKKDPLSSTGGEYSVHPDFEYYVQLFVDKAAERGETIDFSDTGLLVEYSDVISQGASGWCYVGQHYIVIDKSEWDLLSEDEKEFLFAHELGHCELDRPHKNEQFSNGAWKSLMRGDPFTALQSRNPVAFFGFRKDFYWDELFNASATEPTWGEQKFNYNEVSENEKELLEEKTDQSLLQETPNFSGSNYEFEVEFNNIPTQSFLTELTWGASPYLYKIQIYTDYGFYVTAESEGFEQLLFYNNNINTFNSLPFKKITVRQHGGFTKIFFNDEFIFHLDKFDSSLQQIQFESKDREDVLVTGFKVEKYRLHQL